MYFCACHQAYLRNCTPKIFDKFSFFTRVTYMQPWLCSVDLWRRCDMLYISGFIDDVI